MRITLAAIGRMKPSPEQELVRKYQRQLSWTLNLFELEAKKTLSDEQRKAAEAELLLQATASCNVRIALDEGGKTLSSEAFSRTIEGWQLEGRSHLGFMIGGQDGLHASVREAAQLVLSFGAQTWPHMLARAMLCEQLYRAHSILAGHPYHRT